MKNNYGKDQLTNKMGFISENQWNFFLYSSKVEHIMDTKENNGKQSYIEIKKFIGHSFEDLWTLSHEWVPCIKVRDFVT